ncbi:hypothetical protein B0H14DRAFT_2179538, partial [Mycena olivaceomarginata]
DIDFATAALISCLALEDINDIRDPSKSKSREGSLPSDAEWALGAYAEETENVLQFYQDLELARSIDHALELDQPVLSVHSVEDGVRADHLYAEALANGGDLPAQSEDQRLLEDPDFSLLTPEVDDVGESQAADSTDMHASEMPHRYVFPGIACADVPFHFNAHCVICRDDLRPATSFRAPCEHLYCRQFLSDLATTCIGDESLFPLQCCRQNLPMDGPLGVSAQLDLRLRHSLRKKATEFSTVFKDRLYCPQPTCSVFLDST